MTDWGNISEGLFNKAELIPRMSPPFSIPLHVPITVALDVLLPPPGRQPNLLHMQLFAEVEGQCRDKPSTKHSVIQQTTKREMPSLLSVL